MRQEADAAMSQTEHFGRTARLVVVHQSNFFTFAEVVTAAIRAKLADFFSKVRKATFME